MNSRIRRSTSRWSTIAALVFGAAMLVLVGRLSGGRGVNPVPGAAVADPAAIAELTFPIRHATVEPDDAGHWWVSLDDGTTSPDRYKVPASPGQSPHVLTPADGCNCGPITVDVGPDLTVVVSGTWMGRACTFTAGATRPGALRCR